MNLRQAQRLLAELLSDCEAARIQLPRNTLDARAEAVESIIHSLKDGKPSLKDAKEELQLKFGIQLEWKQHLDNEEVKRQRRRRHKKLSSYKKGQIKLAQVATSSDSCGEPKQHQLNVTRPSILTKNMPPAVLTSKLPVPREEMTSTKITGLKTAQEVIAVEDSSDQED